MDINRARFLFDGDDIHDEQTANSLEMEEGATINVAPRKYINLKVVSEDQVEVHFKVKRNTPLRKLIDKYCAHQGLDINRARFLFDGDDIHDEQTANSLEMAEGDTINVTATAVKDGGGAAGEQAVGGRLNIHLYKPNALPAADMERAPAPHCVIFTGCEGFNAHRANGAYVKARKTVNRKPMYLKVGDSTVCLWFAHSHGVWVLSNTTDKKRNRNYLVGFAESSEQGLDLPTEKTNWKVGNRMQSKKQLQPQLKCATATPREFAAAEAKVASAKLALPTRWVIAEATGDNADLINGAYKRGTDDKKNGRSVYDKVGGDRDNTMCLWYTKRGEWMVSTTNLMEQNIAIGYLKSAKPGLYSPADATGWEVNDMAPSRAPTFSLCAATVTAQKKRAILLAGCEGANAQAVNGVFMETKEVHNGKQVYVKVGDPTMRVWWNVYWSVGPRSQKKFDFARNFYNGDNLPTAENPTTYPDWQVYHYDAWRELITLTCVVATKGEVAEAEEAAKMAAKTLGLNKGWIIQNATGPEGDYINGTFEKAAKLVNGRNVYVKAKPALPTRWVIAGAVGEYADKINGAYKWGTDIIVNGKNVYIKAGDNTMCLWYTTSSEWMVSTIDHMGKTPAVGYLKSAERELSSPAGETGWKITNGRTITMAKFRLCRTVTVKADDNTVCFWYDPTGRWTVSLKPEWMAYADDDDLGEASDGGLGLAAPDEIAIPPETTVYLKSLEPGLASPADATSWMAHKSQFPATFLFPCEVKVTALNDIWRLSELRAGGFLRFPLSPRSSTPTAGHKILWPWSKAALWTVSLICAKLIKRPTPRLKRIPPQMWQRILEMVAVDDLGRKPGVAASADVVHSLEVWSMKHETASARLKAEEEVSALKEKVIALKEIGAEAEQKVVALQEKGAKAEQEMAGLRQTVKITEANLARLESMVGGGPKAVITTHTTGGPKLGV